LRLSELRFGQRPIRREHPQREVLLAGAQLFDELVVGAVDPAVGREAILGLLNMFVTPAERVEFRVRNIVADGDTVLTERVDVCLSRAFTPAGTAWTVAQRLLAPGGRLIYWAGRGADLAAELGTEAAFELVPPSEGSDSGPLVVIRRRFGEQ